MLSSWKWVQKNWPDPVWSKVFAAAIIGVFTGIITLVGVGIKALFRKIPFAEAFGELWVFLERSTTVNNGVVVFSLLFLLFLVLINTRIFRKRKIRRSVANISAKVTSLTVRFGLQPGDTNLLDAFKIIKGEPKIATQFDDLYGAIMAFDVNFGPDQLDCTMKLNAQQAKTVTYIYVPIEVFVFYLRIQVTGAQGGGAIQKWIALRLDVEKISEGTGQVEKAYPVKWKGVKGDWVCSTVDIPTIVQEIFGAEGLVYHKLLGFRLRGKGKMASIVLN